jgi:2-keto-4-pentenoate hydratase
MDATAQRQATELLAEARRTGKPLAALGPGREPGSIAEGHAIQDAMIGLIGEPVAGWKVAGLKPGEVMRGAVLASRTFDSPATIPAAIVPLLGIEAEIAFRFVRPLPARSEPYAEAEVRDAVIALPAIEVVDSRFARYSETPLLHRLCDFMSNGALVCGTPRSDWRKFNFAEIQVTLRDGDTVLASTVGGHSAGDPILPAVALANEFRHGRGIDAGEIVTTGTFTGLVFVKPGARVSAEFDGFGGAEATFTA